MLRKLFLPSVLMGLLMMAQTPAVHGKARPAPTGLKILDTTLGPPTPLNPELRPVIVTAQNTTNKTVVAYAFRTHEFDADGREINPGGAGVGMDHAAPDASPLSTKNFIPPGAIRTFSVYSAHLAAVRVEVALTALVYEDRSSEGESWMFFDERQEHAREARVLAAQEPPGEKRAALEKRAEWYEAHAVEAEQ